MTSFLKVVICGLIFTNSVLCGELDNSLSDSETNMAEQCKNNDEIATVCLKCASLPFQEVVTFDACCSDSRLLLFCDACIHDDVTCKEFMQEAYADDSSTVDSDSMIMTEVDDDNDDFSRYMDYSDVYPDDVLIDSDSSPPVEKRFGKLFVNTPKRFGRLWFGKRGADDSQDTGIDKRYGRLYMGSNPMFGKRYGRLYTGSKYRFGKRSDAIAEDALGVDKRWGRIFWGNSRRPTTGRRIKLFGKRSDEMMELPNDQFNLDKRYGKLYVNGGYRFGKRDYDNDMPTDVDALAGTGPIDKRFGRLYMNRMRLFSRPPTQTSVDKRFGRLFTGRRKYLFG